MSAQPGRGLWSAGQEERDRDEEMGIKGRAEERESSPRVLLALDHLGRATAAEDVEDAEDTEAEEKDTDDSEGEQ